MKVITVADCIFYTLKAADLLCSYQSYFLLQKLTDCIYMPGKSVACPKLEHFANEVLEPPDTLKKCTKFLTTILKKILLLFFTKPYHRKWQFGNPTVFQTSYQKSMMKNLYFPLFKEGLCGKKKRWNCYLIHF